MYKISERMMSEVEWDLGIAKLIKAQRKFL